jgi:hypothetical protein
VGPGCAGGPGGTAEPCPSTTLQMLSTSLSNLAGPALLPAGIGGILPGTWGPAWPGSFWCWPGSFWCWHVANQTAGATSFLLHEEHATRFREEYPACVGARLLAAGGKRGSGAKAQRLVVVAAPLGAIQGGKRKKGAGAERFENERCVLSEDGWSYLRARGGHCNLLVWALDFRCAGIDTFLCVADTNILSEPAGGSCIGSISLVRRFLRLVHGRFLARAAGYASDWAGSLSARRSVM